jgi:hypothetical protein
MCPLPPDPDLELAAARVDRAVADRRAERAERMILAEEVSLDAVLADAAASGDQVSIETTTGATHAGYLSGIGEDFVMLVPRHSAPVGIRRQVIASLRRESAGTRNSSAERRAGFVDLLAELGSVEARVRIVGSGGAANVGVIHEVGPDVVLLIAEPAGRAVYLSLDAIAEVSSMSMTSTS